MLKSGHPSIRVRGFRKEAGERLAHCDEEIVWDLSSSAAASTYLAGCRVVIHLAALPKPWESWERIYENNLKIDNVLFAAAAEAPSVKRVVYASTNHVQHGATMRGSPETLDGDRYVSSFTKQDESSKEKVWTLAFYRKGRCFCLGFTRVRPAHLHGGMATFTTTLHSCLTFHICRLSGVLHEPSI